MAFINCETINIPNKGKRIEGKGFVQKVQIQYDKISIRPLSMGDIDAIVSARRNQEEENGNGATEEYLKEYAKVIEKLYQDGNIIGAGAFKDKELISLAFFNLISFGKEKKIPYLCGVWTNPQYRGRKLATKVNDKLLEGVSERIDEMQGNLLLTVEGGEPAYNLYNKEGYKRKTGEMSFLGDVLEPYFPEEEKTIEYDGENTKRFEFTNQNVEQVLIEYSEEQFFSHPSNISGIMCRIIQIGVMNPSLTPEQLRVYLQYFLSKNRFCKFNVEELLKMEPKLAEVLGTNQGDNEQLNKKFEELSFKGINGESLNIKRSESVMENTIENALQHSIGTRGEK